MCRSLRTSTFERTKKNRQNLVLFRWRPSSETYQENLPRQTLRYSWMPLSNTCGQGIWQWAHLRQVEFLSCQPRDWCQSKAKWCCWQLSEKARSQGQTNIKHAYKNHKRYHEVLRYDYTEERNYAYLQWEHYQLPSRLHNVGFRPCFPIVPWPLRFYLITQSTITLISEKR